MRDGRLGTRDRWLLHALSLLIVWLCSVSSVSYAVGFSPHAQPATSDFAVAAGPSMGSSGASSLSSAWAAAQALGVEGQTPAGLFGYDAAALGELQSAAPLVTQAPITLGVSLIPSDPAGLHQMVEEVSTPGTPLTGVFLTPAEYNARFSPPLSHVLEVEQALRAAGFVIVSRSADDSFLLVNGTAGEADSFFSTELLAGIYQGHPAVLPEAPPQVPTALAPDLLAVSGLSQDLTEVELAPLSAGPLGVSPDGGPCLTTCNTIYPDWTHFMYGLDKLYNASSGGNYATSAAIGLLLWGDGYDPSDIQTFLSSMYPGAPFPQPTINAYNLLGAPPPGPTADSDPSNAPMELTLDIEWSVSQAPGATVDAVYVPDGSAPTYSPTDPDLEQGMSVLLNLTGLYVISQSFGAPEGDQSFQATMDLDYEHAALLGISVFAASGDNGGSQLSNGQCTGTAQVEFPASSPYVTAVGGTAPIVNATLGGAPATNQGIASEAAWHLSGGGFSTDFAAPAWQRVGTAWSEISTHGDDRGVPDVAGPAANDTFFYNGQVQDGEGTSFASPMWAGMIAEMGALHGSPLGFLDPKVYALGAAEDQGALSPAPFRYITFGQVPGTSANCLFDAEQGWDPVTGYGSPLSAFDLYADLVASYINLTVSFSPSDAAPGTSVDVNVAALNQSRPFTTGTVTITLWTLPQTLKRTVQLQQSTAAFNAQGQASLDYPIAITYPYGQILVQAEVFDRHDVGSTAGVVVVTLLGAYWSQLQPLLVPPVNYLFFALVMGLATALGWVLGLRAPRKGTHTFSRYLFRRSSRPRPSALPPMGTPTAAGARPAVASSAAAVPPRFAATRPPSGPPSATAPPSAPPGFAGRPATAPTRPATAPPATPTSPGGRQGSAPAPTATPTPAPGSTLAGRPSTTVSYRPPPPPPSSWTTTAAGGAATPGRPSASGATSSVPASTSLRPSSSGAATAASVAPSSPAMGAGAAVAPAPNSASSAPAAAVAGSSVAPTDASTSAETSPSHAAPPASVEPESSDQPSAGASSPSAGSEAPLEGTAAVAAESGTGASSAGAEASGTTAAEEENDSGQAAAMAEMLSQLRAHASSGGEAPTASPDISLPETPGTTATQTGEPAAPTSVPSPEQEAPQEPSPPEQGSEPAPPTAPEGLTESTPPVAEGPSQSPAPEEAPSEAARAEPELTEAAAAATGEASEVAALAPATSQTESAPSPEAPVPSSPEISTPEAGSSAAPATRPRSKRSPRSSPAPAPLAPPPAVPAGEPAPSPPAGKGPRAAGGPGPKGSGKGPKTSARGRTTCPSCGRAVAPAAKTCPSCRAPLKS